MVCALVLGGRLHPDEVHQWLEPAHRWIFGYGTRSTEWWLGMRNVLGPGLVAAVFACCKALGATSATALVGSAQACTAALSLRALVALHRVVARDAGEPAADRAVTLLALSAPFANLAFRPMGESLSVVAALLALEALPAAPAIAGACLGAAFVVRYPSGLLALAPAWSLRRNPRNLLRFAFGGGAVLAVLGIADGVAWGSAFHSVRAYVSFNFVAGRASIDFGSRPAWFYLAVLPLLAPLGALVPPWPRRLGVTGATGLVYVLVMSAVAHKELRFALVAVPFATAALAAGGAWRSRRAETLAIVVTALQSAVIVVGLRHTNYCQGEEARAAMWLGTRGDVREVVMVNATHPGYVRLRRDVPVTGDRHEHCAATVADLARRGGACVPGRFLVCDGRRGACSAESFGAACGVVATFGRTTVVTAR